MHFPSIKTFGFFLGISLIVVGLAGFVPQFVAEGNLLFGIFEVNKLHTSIHILAGVVIVLASIINAKLTFRIVGISTVFVTIYYWNTVFPPSPINFPDKIFHLSFGILSLYLGFFYKPK